jgi:DNA repair protein RadA/Sms
MAKKKTVFVCQECGNETHRWMGQCSTCRAWNTIVEETPPPEIAARIPFHGRSDTERGNNPLPLNEINEGGEIRLQLGVEEIDRVLGGGIVRGSATLIAGDPGIGKSTLMTEFGKYFASGTILYVTGEESPGQVKMRATRLGVEGENMFLLPETNVASIIDCVLDQSPTILIVDSIQTLFRPELQSAPGSVGQVRESAAALIQLAKTTGTAVFIVGHVTKDGSIAGPRVLEHMVDTVLYLEGDRHHTFRILRSVKNRFGSTNEIGVFEMMASGLRPVDNPSRIFLSERSTDTAGAVVVCSMEGTRPILAEIQALVSPTSYPTPQRAANGYDPRRLQMLLAVLEKREGFRLSTHDVFVNVTGGLRLTEPAIDLGIVAAVASSFRDRCVDRQCVLVGEIGLGGEVRPVTHLESRLREAAHLGFKNAFVPEPGLDSVPLPDGMSVKSVRSINDLMDLVV